LGYIQLQQGHLEEAEANLLTAIRLLPASAYSQTNLGILYASTGKLQKAREIFLDVTSSFPNTLRPSRAILRTVALIGLQRIDEAKKMFLVLQERIPNLGKITRDLWTDLEILERDPKMKDLTERFFPRLDRPQPRI
jgi:tetratricopeptide (TPR) repeat protein